MIEARTPTPIDHIGILVPDLEEAIARWTTVLGYRFGPIMRYRTDRWLDSSEPDPHVHNARISLSLDVTPRIELMEFTGRGTHSVRQGAGFHHMAFVDLPDAEERMSVLQELGIGHDGQSLTEDGRTILWFTDPSHLNNVRLEFVSPDDQPVVEDGA